MNATNTKTYTLWIYNEICSRSQRKLVKYQEDQKVDQNLPDLKNGDLVLLRPDQTALFLGKSVKILPIRFFLKNYTQTKKRLLMLCLVETEGHPLYVTLIPLKDKQVGCLRSVGAKWYFGERGWEADNFALKGFFTLSAKDPFYVNLFEPSEETPLSDRKEFKAQFGNLNSHHKFLNSKIQEAIEVDAMVDPFYDSEGFCKDNIYWNLLSRRSKKYYQKES